MWKFISYNNLMYDKVQRILSDYEENGYIVEKVKFGHFFKLRKRKSDSIGKYIFVYHHPKGEPIGNEPIESELKDRCHFNQIDTVFEPKLYRGTDEALDEIKHKIKKHHLKCAIEKILLSLFFVVFFTAGAVWGFVNGEVSSLNYVLTAFASLSLAYMLKYCITAFLLRWDIRHK